MEKIGNCRSAPTRSDKLRIQDLTGLAPYLELKGFPVELVMEGNNRVVGLVTESEDVQKLMLVFQAGGITVDLLHFLSVQRRIRGKLLDLRSQGKDGHGYGNFGHGTNRQD